MQLRSWSVLLGILVLGTQSAAAPLDATIQWTSAGIPHVTAADYRSLGFGQGYAAARDRVCLLADRILTLRGERSLWYGPDAPAVVGFLPSTNLNSDLFYRVQLSEASATEAASRLDPKVREMAHGYALGFNRFVRDHEPQKLVERCAEPVMPEMNELDVVRAMQSIGTIWKALTVVPFAASSAWGKTPATAQVTEPEAMVSASLGSNVWAYGGELTGKRGAMVVANPHSYWRGHWLSMRQVHLTIPGEIDVAGADFVGLPLPVTGFNRDIAWSIEAPSTVSYFVLQRISVDETSDAPSYIVDGERKPLALRTVEVPVKQADGSLEAKRFAIAHTQLGPIYRLPEGRGRPAGWYAITDAGDGNAQGLNQLLHVARSKDVKSFVQAIEQSRGLGAHFVAGDRHGDVVYVEAGPLLDITDEALEACRLAGQGVPFNVLDGSRSACSVRASSGAPRLLAAEKFPVLRGQGVIHNTNNSYRFSLHGRDTRGYSRLLGDPNAEPFNLRLMMSDRRVSEVTADRSVTETEALSVLFDNRNYAAEAWLDSLLALGCGEQSTQLEACSVLRSWDRKNDSASRGALLFGEFWKRVSRLDGLFASAVDQSKPFAVRAVATAQPVRVGVEKALVDAIAALNALGLTGAEPWGQVLSVRTAKGKVAMHGGPAEQGVLNSIEGRSLGRDGFDGIAMGTDYVQLVQWLDDAVQARTLLAHGQSDDPRSVHFDDQLEAFAAKQLTKFPFTAAEIRVDARLTTIRLQEPKASPGALAK